MPTDQDVDQMDDLDQDIQDIDQDDAQGNRRKRRIPIIPITILLLVIGSLTAVFGFNVFNVRDGFIYPALSNIPFVGNLIPSTGEYTYEYEYVYQEGEWVLVAVPVPVPPAQEVPDEDAADVEALLSEIEELRAALAQAEAINEESSRTIVAMRESHELITQYRHERELLEQTTALDNPDAFLAFFSTMDPDRAANIYAHIRATNQQDREFRRYASTYHRMDTGEAAEVFTLLLSMNPDLLIDILWTFNNDQRAEIFNEMEAEHVAIITILMEPDVDSIGVLPPIQMIGGAAAPPVPVFAAVADTPPAPTEPEAADDGDEEESEEV